MKQITVNPIKLLNKSDKRLIRNRIITKALLILVFGFGLAILLSFLDYYNPLPASGFWGGKNGGIGGLIGAVSLFLILYSLLQLLFLRTILRKNAYSLLIKEHPELVEAEKLHNQKVEKVWSRSLLIIAVAISLVTLLGIIYLARITILKKDDPQFNYDKVYYAPPLD